jgi:hypothetical protein
MLVVFLTLAPGPAIYYINVYIYVYICMYI